jgi:hypothetical protein
MGPSERHARRAKIALGLAMICGLFLIETTFAHRVHPSPLSPWVWGLLATLGLGCLFFAVFSAWKSKHTR